MADNAPPQIATSKNTPTPKSDPTSTSADELPARMRVHALAKLLGVTSKTVLANLQELGVTVASAQSSIDRDVAEQVRVVLARTDAPAPDAAAPAPGDTSTVAPVVTAPLFLQPEPVAAPPRRRASRPAAAPDAQPSSEEPELQAPAEQGSVEHPQDNAEQLRDNDETSEDEDAPKRRRRGRRGRGRGRGPQSEEANEGDTEGRDSGEQKTEEQQTGEPGTTASGKTAKDDRPADGGSATANGEDSADADADDAEQAEEGGTGSRRRRRRRRKSGNGGGESDTESGDNRDNDPPNTVVHEREPRVRGKSGKGQAKDSASKDADPDQVQGITGSTRLEAKRQRRRDGRDAGRRRPAILSESEFLARREAVNRKMVVRQHGQQTQVAVLEDDVLVEHFVTSSSSNAMVGNVYLGRVQNVLPSMEAAFIDVGRGRNGVLYAGEVDWDAAGLGGKARKIEQALHSGDNVLVQVSKDPVGHKGARLTTQISLPGRFLVYVPGGGSTGISRKLPDTERKRLKEILKRIVPADAGVIIRTASEGVSEDELERDVSRLQAQWTAISAKAAEVAAAKTANSTDPVALYEEPDLLVKVVRDQFNEDFSSLVVAGEQVWETVEGYVNTVAPDLLPRVERYTGDVDVFTAHRIDEQLAKALDRKVWLPSGGTLVIDRTEAMTVVDVNTGKFTGAGGNLEETVTRNNLEAAEEIVRQMRLRDIGGMIVVDFIDMVLESNRDLVLRRLTECLGRDRTRHQVSEVTSLGLVQMTRKRMGAGLIEEFSVPCEHCHGRGVLLRDEPVVPSDSSGAHQHTDSGRRARRSRTDPPVVKQMPTVKEPWPAALIPASSAAAQAAAAQAVAPQPPEAVDPADTAAAAVDAAAEPSPGDGNAAAGGVVAEATAAPESGPAPHSSAATEGVAPARKGRARRASRPAAAPEPVSAEPTSAEPTSAEPASAEPTSAEPVIVDSDAGPAPVPAGEPSAAEPAPSDPTPGGPAVPAAGVATRKSRPRRASRPTAAPEPMSAEPVSAEPLSVVTVSAGPVGASDANPASESASLQPPTSPEPVVTAVAPAPPARPRRRRAAARPAGPPVDGGSS